MHVKSIILVALTIASLALARGITSKAVEEERDDDNNSNNEETMESDLESAPEPVIALTPSSVPECALAANAQTDRTLANTDQTRVPNLRSMFDRMDVEKRINTGRRLNLDKIRNGIMARASSHPSNGLWHILDNFDFLKPHENREGLAAIIPNLIDPLIIPPQMQYVDNTLRLMSIKNTVDDLIAKIFPNLHMIQHPTEQNKN